MTLHTTDTATNTRESIFRPPGHRAASRTRRLITPILEMTLAVTAVAAVWVATRSLTVVVVAAVILAGSRVVVAVRAWRSDDLGLAEWTFFGALLGAGLGAGLLGHTWWGQVVLGSQALSLVVAYLNPNAVRDRISTTAPPCPVHTPRLHRTFLDEQSRSRR